MKLPLVTRNTVPNFDWTGGERVVIEVSVMLSTAYLVAGGFGSSHVATTFAATVSSLLLPLFTFVVYEGLPRQAGIVSNGKGL